MNQHNTNDIIPFTKVFRRILYLRFGDAAAEIYSSYQRRCGSLYDYESDAEIIKADISFFRMHAALHTIQSLYYTYDTIDAFDVIPKEPEDEVRILDRADFLEECKVFFKNDGQKKNDRKRPKSILYFSRNILGYIHNNEGEQVFHESFVMNDTARQLQDIYLQMYRKNYVITEDVTVKEFYRDIIEPLYPDLSDNFKNYIWKLFKK